MFHWFLLLLFGSFRIILESKLQPEFSFINRQFCRYHWLLNPFFSQWFLGYSMFMYEIQCYCVSLSFLMLEPHWFNEENLVAVFYIIRDGKYPNYYSSCAKGTSSWSSKQPCPFEKSLVRSWLVFEGKIEIYLGKLNIPIIFALSTWKDGLTLNLRKSSFISLREDLMFSSSSLLIFYHWLLVKLLI